MLATARKHGGALVETCQRVETVGFEPCAQTECQTRLGEAAFDYLCRLASGLESVVLGESEILGQLRLAARGAAPDTERAIARAVAVGRAFRRRHGLTADAGQLFDLGLRTAAVAEPASVLVLGSGPTARRLASRAVASGAAVTVSSRVQPAWAVNTEFRWIRLDHIACAAADVAFVCLGGDAPVLPVGVLRSATVVDVSTPRRTNPGDPAVVSLAAIRDETMSIERDRREALRTALDSEVRLALDAWRNDATSPVGRLRQSVEQMRQAELRRLRRRHPEIPEATIDAVTRSIVNRMFHQPVVRLKALEPNIADSVADLFAAPTGGGRE